MLASDSVKAIMMKIIVTAVDGTMMRGACGIGGKEMIASRDNKDATSKPVGREDKLDCVDSVRCAIICSASGLGRFTRSDAALVIPVRLCFRRMIKFYLLTL